MSALGQKQTCAVQLGMSAMGHKRTLAPLIGQLICAGEHGCRNFQTERFCRPEVDDQLKFGWLLDRQVGWLRALKDLVHKIGSALITIGERRSVAHQTSRLSIL